MDDATLGRAEDELVLWGVLEREDGLRPTRRFRGALARAALALQELEKRGQAPAGHPVANVVALALEGTPLPAGAVAGDEHRACLVAVQVASLPEAARRLLGI